MTGFELTRLALSLNNNFSTTERCIYAVLASHANKKNYSKSHKAYVVWPSVKRIAEMAGCCPRTVHRTLKVLVSHGLVGINHRKVKGSSYNLSNEYYLKAPKPEQLGNFGFTGEKRPFWLRRKNDWWKVIVSWLKPILTIFSNPKKEIEHNRKAVHSEDATNLEGVTKSYEGDIQSIEADNQSKQGDIVSREDVKTAGHRVREFKNKVRKLKNTFNKKNKKQFNPKNTPPSVCPEAWADYLDLLQRAGKPLPDSMQYQKQSVFLARHTFEVQRIMVDTAIRMGWKGIYEITNIRDIKKALAKRTRDRSLHDDLTDTSWALNTVTEEEFLDQERSSNNRFYDGGCQ